MAEERAARERMEYDVVVVGAGPAGPRRRDPPEAARRRGGHASICGLRRSRRARRSARISFRARCSSRARSTSCSPIGESAARRWSRRRPTTAFCCLTEAPRLPPADPAADAQSRQLHHQPRQSLPLAGDSRPRRSGSRSIPALPRPRCCTTRAAGCAASRPAIWGSARTASRPSALPARRRAAAPRRRCSPKAAAAR